MIDIAFIPLRLSMENVGDMRPFFRRYAELTGETFEPEVLAFHAVWWALCTPFILTADLHDPPAHATYFEYIGWYVGILMSAFQVLADMKRLQLDKNPDVKEAQPSRWARIFDVMAARVPQRAADEPYSVREQRNFLELARRMDAFRDLEADYLKDVERLVGRPVRNWKQADEELEKFVLNADSEHDEALIALFYDWCRGQATTFLNGLVDLPLLDRPRQRFAELIV
jgi:hypothetical protein